MGLSDLPTLADMAADRAGKPLWKGKSRLELRTEKTPLTYVNAKAFRHEVWTRCKSQCQHCLRKVIRTISRVPERGEVHHIHGRLGLLRFDARAAILLCSSCHELFTGKVNERWIIVATKTFILEGREYTDARFPVVFKRVA